MKERPILFSGPMVRAILEGRKTQTRRVINSVTGIGRVTEFQASDTPGYAWTFRDKRFLWNDMTTPNIFSRCPHGQPGDRLWVREEWRIADSDLCGCGGDYCTCGCNGQPIYAASYSADTRRELMPWRPSIHMQRWACRLVLEITDVRVERLQDVSEEDALAEGAVIGAYYDGATREPTTYREAFSQLWDSLATPGARWDANPWVWAITFRKVRG